MCIGHAVYVLSVIGGPLCNAINYKDVLVGRKQDPKIKEQYGGSILRRR
jgi:hypothetical protein